MKNQVLKTQESFTSENGVSNLLGKLKRVDAPGDFDFRVRARIAAGRPVEKSVSWMPASVRYAVPLALFLFVGGYFAFNAAYSTNTVDAPVVALTPTESIAPLALAESPQVLPAVPESPRMGTIPERPDVASLETSNRILRSTARGVSNPKPRVERPVGGGSYDSAVRQSSSISPTGNNLNAQMPANAKLPVPTNQISALGSMGIKAVSAGTLWTVQSVSGAAARAGVRAGDVIESVNGGNLKIRRDGKTVLVVVGR